MNQKEALQRLLEEKIKRQDELNAINQQLDELEVELTSSRMGRWFGSTYLLTKRIITVLLALFLLLIAGYGMIYPEKVFNNKDTKELVEASKNDYFDLIGKTIGETIVESFRKGKPFSANRINREFSKAFEHILLQELYSVIRVLAFLLVPLAIFLLYISRLTKKMRQRNHKISEAQQSTQEIIKHYKSYIKDAEDEIETVRVISRMEPSNFNS